jgi:DNA-binding response OmpR family regulator
MLKILVAEDNKNIRELIAKNLENNNFIVLKASDGQVAYEIYEKEHIDLVVTDVMMPNTDGIALSKLIREDNDEIPIIMLTALSSYEDKETGFATGIDDYLVKPVDMKELILRVKSQLRRYKTVSKHVFEHGELKLNHNELSCLVKGSEVILTNKEFSLLYKLCSSNGRIFTRTQLMDEIWGYDSESYERTVDTHIKRLREKIKTDSVELVTVRGLGYKVVLK